MTRFPHLKQYVREHPDNKMAWYLLGKEYEADGQPGKANYCFNKAQEVYEAYEHAHVPEDILAEYEEKLHLAAEKRQKKAAGRRRWLLLAVLLLLAGFRYAEAPGMNVPRTAAQPDVLAGAAPDAAPEVFTAGETGNPASLGTAAAAYLQDGRRVPVSVLGLERSGKWLLWNKTAPVIAEIEPGSAPGESVLRSYDPKTCDCEANVSGAERKAARVWMNEQESLAALSSAIVHYREGAGKLPGSLEELNRPFPRNVLSGSTPAMKRSFAVMAAMSKRKAYGQEVPPPSEGGPSVSAATLGGSPYLDEPLEIVVDRSRHRLALVSGNVLLRSYEVGLGGSRTPTGTYVISDKVVNPNGRSDGEFGSRGMQLSDTDYAIHGTDEPESIGGDESHGCVRMNREDIEELFDLVPAGTKVTLADDVLPEETLVPKQRFRSENRQDQTNDKKVYKWLN
ncbi:L,D-transpeptidase [Saccharibacillus alkalitolerans]|uniref:L,D-transpeptidase n=1 Tax=Saccharibacillus alkalitolerans TaxID=2705290 RepID=A0ABX0F406_9BACL|nr:L,D-transpeptidase [Saccharibacillus alkalitolerans]NGZ75696.1 L,D-transpeptidase [Saccharibacillus alkalitolerans]